jgi:hypothetical protein
MRYWFSEDTGSVLTGSKHWTSSMGRRRCSDRRCPATGAPARSSRSPGAWRQTRKRAGTPTAAEGASSFSPRSGYEMQHAKKDTVKCISYLQQSSSLPRPQKGEKKKAWNGPQTPTGRVVKASTHGMSACFLAYYMSAC